MKKVLTGAMAALTLGGGLLATATPAAAHPWGGWGHGYDGGYRGYDRGYGGGALLGAGVLGLAVGAALSSSYQPHYYAPPVYYAPPPIYYGPPTYVYAAPRCRVHYRWNGWGQYVPVQRCW